MIRMEREKEEIAREEVLTARAEEGVKYLLELVKMDSLKVGVRCGFEQILSDPLSWIELNEAGKQVILKVVSSHLGVDLINVPEEQVIGRYRDEGESGAEEVTVLKTREPQLTIHILKYVDPDLATRFDFYDFVRES